MKKKLYNIVIGAAAFVAATLFVSFGANAQAPAIGMQKSLGGSATERASSGVQTSDGGYIMTGYTASNSSGDVTSNHGGTDVWVAKITATGTLSWQKSLGSNVSESANSIIQTSDGGYIFAGYTNATINGDVSGGHGSNDWWVVKLTSTGTISWQKCLGGTGADNAYSIKETFDGGFIVAGFNSSINGDVTGNHGGTDAWVVRLSSTGSIMWQRSMGGANSDYAMSAIQTSDTGYLVVGYSNSSDADLSVNHGSHDIWVVKLDKFAITQWSKSVGGSSSDYGYAVTELSDGAYAIAGSSYSNDVDITSPNGNGDFLVIKLSQTGSVLWTKNYGGSDEEEARGIQPTAAGGMIVAGYSLSNDSDVTGNHGGEDIWVLKLSASGAIQWEQSYGGTNSDETFCISKTSDDGYFLGGTSYSTDGDATANAGAADYWAVKLDACTPSVPTISVSGTTLSTTATYDTYQWLLSGAPIAGATNATYVATASGDYKVDVTNSYGCPAQSATQTFTMPTTGIRSADMSEAGISVYPNPSIGSFTVTLPQSNNEITVIVTDMLGKTIAVANYPPNSSRNASVSLDSTPAGNYIIKVTDGDKTYRDKLMVIK